MKSVALHNLGCKVNGYELDVMQQMLQEKGYNIVSFDEWADIYIVNTCTVTNIADRKSRQMLHKARKLNPKAVVVAAGCYVQTGKEDIIKDVGVDLAIGNNKKKELVSILEKYLEECGKGESGKANEKTNEETEVGLWNEKTLDDTTIIDIGSISEFENMELKETSGNTRAYIKVQDGCNQFCSYCIIPYARGRVRSRRQEDVLQEITGLAKHGYKEVVLTGIHISSYGVDFGAPALPELIKAIHEVEGIERIRLGSLEPGIITEEFAEKLRILPKFCPHFHLSLQSGCDETLKRMNRKYTSGEYYEKVKLLRRTFDNPAITTDIIVGFPGETEEEFQITRAYLEKIKLYEIHVFKYSKRKGTRAAEMEHQVTDEKKTQRSNILLAMERENSTSYRAEYIGREIEVLFEEEKEIDGVLYQTGHTAQYVKAAKRAEGTLSNQLISGKAVGFLQGDILLME
ncbi:tRNA (N(6)-L-threonylcarbamoyladenosine(37)-C(2))-methylthiotransferase MtaB [Kineothrix sp. MB12-C1]|uniref:tRNA (N(6)-L-threonylcarbamoyladenosine(37)-C(2))- methylthiotransferase MtaB n=1 Tax=Kineothrix sp. MB12-C1 TaxID=3070215 RepID=UPI0027D299B0|nr:tRNA (N(6)-L-threonylcarbamoyladenosine(37)-C(2))-methylthiotransferase MtaB [Kineothrix sp. MB12-C1]WMC91563.1 tRNA (N(6)-L-threonylcarbamoyladenosine(37)-C(2))-methylthiotransferase MtaB [Kineothrix sp. MB12-C1]